MVSGKCAFVYIIWIKQNKIIFAGCLDHLLFVMFVYGLLKFNAAAIAFGNVGPFCNDFMQ